MSKDLPVSVHTPLHTIWLWVGYLYHQYALCVLVVFELLPATLLCKANSLT